MLLTEKILSFDMYIDISSSISSIRLSPAFNCKITGNVLQKRAAYISGSINSRGVLMARLKAQSVKTGLLLFIIVPIYVFKLNSHKKE